MAVKNALMAAALLVCGLIVISLLISVAVAGANAAGNSATNTPVPHNDPTATPTAVPTPAPRTVFSDPRWDVDHISILVTNSGAPIIVDAYIDTPSNRNIVPVDKGISKRVSTLPVTPENGRIITYGFKAFENGTLIQSYENSIVIAASPTPPPETVTVSGTVLDAVTNLPLNGAEVIFTSETYDKQYPSAFTDSSGTFVTVGKMYPDSYMITVKASGYKTVTGLEIKNVSSGVQKISPPIMLDPVVTPSTTVTPAPGVTPSPMPGSFIDAWLNLLYNPTVCISTIALTLGAIVSATAIYEWTLRQRERRRREEDTSGTKDTKENK